MKVREIERLIEARHREALEQQVPMLNKRFANELRELREHQQRIDRLAKALERRIPKTYKLPGNYSGIDVSYGFRIPARDRRLLRALEEATALKDRKASKKLLEGLVKRWKLGKVAGGTA